jgi:hypothetical protein
MIASASSDATVRIYKNRKLKNKLEFFHKFSIKMREETVDDLSTAQLTELKPKESENVQMTDENLDLNS